MLSEHCLSQKYIMHLQPRFDVIAVQLAGKTAPEIDHFVNAFKKKEKLMAHHKSALKRVRQTAKRTVHNRSMRADLRTNIKKFRLLQESGNLEQARDAYPNVQKNIDKAVTKGVLHKRTGARYKSRLAQYLAKSTSS